MKEISIYDINDYVSNLLNVSQFDDIAINGVQVACDTNITGIAFAVDACVDTIELAAKYKCQALITHHGIFWGKPQAIVGSHGLRVTALIRNGISLASYHIPLDASDVCGNNIMICKSLGLKDLQPFAKFKGSYVGYVGVSEDGLVIEDVLAKLEFDADKMPYTYFDFGKKSIRKIAVVSGGAGNDIYEAARIGADLFITGECSHELYHFAKETGMNALFAGHYFTETFGIKALSECIRKQFPSVNVIYFDVPTGL